MNLKFKIVPVSINYERLFDDNLLASEMISGKFRDISLFDLTKKITSLPPNKVGKVFIKYSEPIDLEHYLSQNKLETTNFNEVALKLTNDLYEFQFSEQPITKSTIVSSILLFSQKPVISIKKILAIS